MTVIERLVVNGLLKEFDESVKNKNKEKLVTILKKVDLSDSDIEDVLRKYNMKYIPGSL